MACKLTSNYDLIFAIFNIPKDTRDVDLKIHTLWRIYTYKKDRSCQVSKYSPLGTEVKPFPPLQRKMMGYLKQRQVITTPYANRSYQPRTKATVTKRHNLLSLTRSNIEKLSHPRKVNGGSFPKAKPRTWLTALRGKELEATAFQQAHTKLSKSVSQ